MYEAQYPITLLYITVDIYIRNVLPQTHTLHKPAYPNVRFNFCTHKLACFHLNTAFSCTYADPHCPLYISGREWNSKAKSPCHICHSSPIQWHRLRCPRMHLAREQLTCPPAYLSASRAPRGS